MESREKELRMMLLEKLIASMDDEDTKRFESMSDEELDEAVEEEEKSEEPMARVVEEKTVPMDKVGDYVAEKVDEAQDEEEEEEDLHDLPWVRDLKKKRRK